MNLIKDLRLKNVFDLDFDEKSIRKEFKPFFVLSDDKIQKTNIVYCDCGGGDCCDCGGDCNCY